MHPVPVPGSYQEIVEDMHIVGHTGSATQTGPDAVKLLAGADRDREEETWRMTGIDPEGLDLECEGRTRRAEFPSAIRAPSEVRTAVVNLTRAARAKG